MNTQNTIVQCVAWQNIKIKVGILLLESQRQSAWGVWSHGLSWGDCFQNGIIVFLYFLTDAH